MRCSSHHQECKHSCIDVSRITYLYYSADVQNRGGGGRRGGLFLKLGNFWSLGSGCGIMAGLVGKEPVSDIEDANTFVLTFGFAGAGDEEL